MNRSDVTVDILLKAIHKECVQCQGMKEWRVFECDMITCPLHQFLGLHSVQMAPPKKVKENLIDTEEETKEPKKRGKRAKEV